ncbi:MAG: DUF998 domain-containing protein [Actinomycetota bacterium]|nr:DUF998 domain-containing protein [Actinomycetota bacterium]
MSLRNAVAVYRSPGPSSRDGEQGTSTVSARKAGPPPALMATVAIAGTAGFLVLIGALHVLSPDFDPIQRPTSEYAVGPFGYLMTAAFVAMSAATWALIIGLARDLPKHARSRLGLGFLGVWAIGLLVAAAFPIDLDGAPPTVAGAIHSINGPLTFISLVIGMNLVSHRFGRDSRWLPIQRIARPLALLVIVEFVAGGVAAATETGAGIAQRILLATFSAWFILVAARLLSNARERTG